MPTQTKKFPGFTGNELKLIAMIAMTCDHVGLQLLPGVPVLRIIGRLALPIYAYMIAEGCRYTRSRKKYLLRIAQVDKYELTQVALALGKARNNYLASAIALAQGSAVVGSFHSVHSVKFHIFKPLFNQIFHIAGNFIDI